MSGHHWNLGVFEIIGLVLFGLSGNRTVWFHISSSFAEHLSSRFVKCSAGLINAHPIHLGTTLSESLAPPGFVVCCYSSKKLPVRLSKQVTSS